MPVSGGVLSGRAAAASYVDDLAPANKGGAAGLKKKRKKAD